MPASATMIATTTSISMRVKAARRGRRWDWGFWSSMTASSSVHGRYRLMHLKTISGNPLKNHEYAGCAACGFADSQSRKRKSAYRLAHLEDRQQQAAYHQQ